jgi:hypothetical protein
MHAVSAIRASRGSTKTDARHCAHWPPRCCRFPANLCKKAIGNWRCMVALRSNHNVGVDAPHTGVTLPRAGVTLPRAGVTLPHTGVTLPHTGVTLPHTGVTRPHTGVTLPHAGVALPHTGVTLPHAAVTMPLTPHKDRQTASQSHAPVQKMVPQHRRAASDCDGANLVRELLC